MKIYEDGRGYQDRAYTDRAQPGHHHGQRLQLWCREQRTRREEQRSTPTERQGRRTDEPQHTYDPQYCLASATGTYAGADNKSASYTLSMGYDNMHRITSKKQHLTQSNVQFNGTLNAGYDLTYTYNNDEGKKFQLASVRDINYRTEETPTDSTNINNGHKYSYDANGNLVYINTSRVKHDGKEDDRVSEQKYKWDEENRFLAADENYSIKRKKAKLACTMPSAANRRVKLNAKELDEEMGMYYYGARYYEPVSYTHLTLPTNREV